MSSLTAIQRAAVLTGLAKAVSSSLDEQRAAADEALASLYDTVGADRVKVTVGDVEVGTFSVSYSKEGWEVTDQDALEDFALAQGFAHEERSIRPEYMSRAIELLADEDPAGVQTETVMDKGWEKLLTNVGGVACFLDTAEPVPGVEFVPAGPKGTTMRGCEPEKVLPAVRALGGMDELLLGAGDE